MSSALQSVLTSLQQNDYTTLAILTAVGYDYVLTFSNEIEYIWSKPWTWVSTLFILVRYFGLCCIVIISLVGSSFLPGPAKTCQIIVIINGWILSLFIGAADFVMILRVWAMYNRSRLMLGALLVLFSLEIILVIVPAAFISDPKNVSAATIQILDFSYCVVGFTPVIWTQVAAILQITHGTVMCMLAFVQFVRQSLQMYRVTKQWQLDRYMNLLVRQGILYFLVIFVTSLINVFVVSGGFPTGWQGILLFLLQYVPLFTLIPRFILSIREMYARDVHGRRGSGIDTGFGLSSSGRDAGGTAVVFADVEQDEDLECVGEASMEVGTTQPE